MVKTRKEGLEKYSRSRADFTEMPDDYVKGKIQYIMDRPLLFDGGTSESKAWETMKQNNPQYAFFDDENLGEPASWLVPKHINSNTNNPQISAAACISASSDDAYLDEWVDYHHALGFDHFYIYDSESLFTLEKWGTWKGGHVTIRLNNNIPVFHNQQEAWEDCIKQGIDRHSHLAILDTADFVVLQNDHELLQELLQQEKNQCISMKTYLFRTGGKALYEPLPVTKRFNMRQSQMLPDDDEENSGLIVSKELLRNNPQLVTKADGLCETATDSAVVYRYTRSTKECELKNPGAARCRLEGEMQDDTMWAQVKRYLPKYANYDGLYQDGPTSNST